MSVPTSSRQPPSSGVRSTASGCPVPDSAWARPPPKTPRTGGGSRLSALITACPDGGQTLPSGGAGGGPKPPPPSAGAVPAAAPAQAPAGPPAAGRAAVRESRAVRSSEPTWSIAVRATSSTAAPATTVLPEAQPAGLADEQAAQGAVGVVARHGARGDGQGQDAQQRGRVRHPREPPARAGELLERDALGGPEPGPLPGLRQRVGEDQGGDERADGGDAAGDAPEQGGAAQFDPLRAEGGDHVRPPVVSGGQRTSPLAVPVSSRKASSRVGRRSSSLASTTPAACARRLSSVPSASAAAASAS